MKDKSLREQYKEEYRAWRNMRQRCNNKNVPNYHRYGGRGIKICKEWDSFEVFLQDMGKRLSPEHSLERRNNNGNYEPANCYWATMDIQSNNQEKNILLEYNGDTKTLAQWARYLNVPYDQIRGRYRYGWDAKSIIETPKNKYHTERKISGNSRVIHYNGQRLTVAGWAKKLGCSYDVLRNRLRNGWDEERTITTPTRKGNLYKDR